MILDDIAADALSVTVQRGIARLLARRTATTESGWRDILARNARIGHDMILRGTIRAAVKNLRLFGMYEDIATGLAALAMQPGGLRVMGMIFCARHCPAGEPALWRYACRECSPGLTSQTIDDRDVIPLDQNWSDH